MIKRILGAVAVVAIVFVYGLAWGAAVYPQAQPQANLGVALPGGIAVFETSLQNRISSTDTSMTLVSTTTRGGGSLNGYQCFTVDEGRSDAEYVCGDLTAAKTVSNLVRGLDPLTGTTTNSALKFAHRVGSNVKITDFPLIQRMRSQLSGTDTIASLMRYETGVTPASGGDLVDYEYVTGLAFSGAGVVDATSIAKGVAELATGAEAAASTPTGSSGNLVLPASLATSTWSSYLATGSGFVPTTGGTGKVSGLFIATSTLYAYTFPTGTGTASTTISSNGAGGSDWRGYTGLMPVPTFTAVNASASTTIYSAVIPASYLGTNNVLRVTFPGFKAMAVQGNQAWIEASYGTGATTTLRVYSGNSYGINAGDLQLVIQNTSASAQNVALTFNGASTTVATSTTATNSANSQLLLIRAKSEDVFGTFMQMTEILR